MAPYAGTLTILVDATFGILGLIAVFSIAYNLAGSYGMDSLSAGVLRLAAFFVATYSMDDTRAVFGYTNNR